ncbi:uncharacterized protein LOC119280790 [Triticum dicoccoides]|uniref:uncharacterized protein LOC119280790 n=1 Tax=Triticum dicoccoides TaxID=85692 RepID=UPI00188E2A9E|nr:uncharacterized protein LOC119280790 [Triticum dicoccoides]
MYLAQTLQEQDVLSLKELVDTTTLEESPSTATSLPSPQDTIEISPSSWCCLSSNPSMAREGRVHRAASGFLGDEEAADGGQGGEYFVGRKNPSTSWLCLHRMSDGVFLDSVRVAAPV